MLRAHCVLCVSAGPRCSAILWRLRVLCGWGGGGGSCTCLGSGAVPPPPPPFSPFGLAIALWAGRAALPTCAALRAGVAAELLLVLLWRATALCDLPPPWYQWRG